MPKNVFSCWLIFSYWLLHEAALNVYLLGSFLNKMRIKKSFQKVEFQHCNDADTVREINTNSDMSRYGAGVQNQTYLTRSNMTILPLSVGT